MLELEVRVKSLEKELDDVLAHPAQSPAPASTPNRNTIHAVGGRSGGAAQCNRSVRRARDRVSEAVKRAIAECEHPSSRQPMVGIGKLCHSPYP